MLFNDFGISNNAISISAAELSLSVLRSLLNQFGAQFIKDMITLYITVSSRLVLIFLVFYKNNGYILPYFYSRLQRTVESQSADSFGENIANVSVSCATAG